MTDMTPAPFPEFDGSQACRAPNVDPDWWFPDNTAGQNGAQDAIAVCNTCDWLKPCLAYALTTGVSGVWGGTTEATRRQIRQQFGIRPAFAAPFNLFRPKIKPTEESA